MTLGYLVLRYAHISMATGSFFFGQAKLFPAEVRESGLLAIPALLPFALLLYWLIRVRVWPLIRMAWALRVAQQPSEMEHT